MGNDVFISYSHIDNRPFGEADRCWVADFHAHLETRILAWLGKPARMWRDPKLGGADVLDDTIDRELRGSTILVSILSPAWISSTYCQRELTEFLAAAHVTGGIRVGTKSRLVKILKLPVESKRVHAELSRTIGFEFFVIDQDSGRPRELSLHPDSKVRRRYWAKVDDVAYEIKEVLDQFNGNDGSGGDGGSGPSGNSPPLLSPEQNDLSLFVAQTSPDLQMERDQLIRELRDRGWRIISADLPLDENNLAQIVTDLVHAKLSIHMLGARYDLQSDLQHRAAAEANVPTIVWMHTGHAPPDPQQLDLLGRLQHFGQSEWIESSLSVLIPHILDRLRYLTQPSARLDAAPTVYVLCLPPDLTEVEVVREKLLQAQMAVQLPLFGDDVPVALEMHRQVLLKCDAVLICWGSGSDAWLHSKQSDILRAESQRTTPFVSKTVLPIFPRSESLTLRRERDTEVERLGQVIRSRLRELRR